MTTSFFARTLFFGALSALLSAVAASATPLTVQLVNAGDPAEIASSVTIGKVTQQSVYIGPYTLAIDGHNLAAMCIDFDIPSYVGDTYQAYATAIGSSNLSNTYAPSAGQQYKEQAYLFSLLVQPSADRLGIQEAAWDITAYDITNSSYTSLMQQNSYIDAALANYSSFSTLGYYLISDTTKGGEQEFVTYYADPSASSVTPEPSSFVLMLAPALLTGVETVRRRHPRASFLS